MKRTRPLVLIVVAVLAAAIGFVLDQALTAMSRPTFVPDVVLAIMLVMVGVILVIMSLPIRRAKLDKSAPRVDPFRALRTVMFAQASSLLGAGVAGFAAGLLTFVLTRPVSPPVGSVSVTVATAGAAIVLVVCALVAESFCSLPKDDDDESHGPDGPTASSPA